MKKKNVLPFISKVKRSAVHGVVLETPLIHRSRLRIQRDGKIYTIETRSNLGYCKSVIDSLGEREKIMDELGRSIMRICEGELLSIEILGETTIASIA